MKNATLRGHGWKQLDEITGYVKFAPKGCMNCKTALTYKRVWCKETVAGYLVFCRTCARANVHQEKKQ